MRAPSELGMLALENLGTRTSCDDVPWALTLRIRRALGIRGQSLVIRSLVDAGCRFNLTKGSRCVTLCAPLASDEASQARSSSSARLESGRLESGFSAMKMTLT